MKAMVLTGHGGLDMLQYHEDYPEPVAGPGEALIRVKACGLNNTDINTRTAWYSKQVTQGITQDAVLEGYKESSEGDGSWGNNVITFPRIQGADVCGIVESTGPGEHSTLLGKRVIVDPWFLDSENPDDLSRARYFGSEVDGGYAEYALAPVENIHVLDSAYSDAELATFACAYSTAENLITRAGLGEGESVVISGASGGVGSAAIQLARTRGARVIAISSKGKIEALYGLGVDEVVDRGDSDLPGSIRKAVGGAADVAVDVVGGDTFGVLIDCLGQGGRYSSSGCISGPLVEFDLRKLVYRDLQLSGATVVPPGTFARLVKLIESGQLKALLAETWPLEKLVEAQQSFMQKNHIGNIVVTME